MESIVKDRADCSNSRHYPWFICSLSFLLHFLVISFYGSFGPLYVEMLRCFHGGDAATAWIPSVSFSIAFIISPITYPLTEKIGYRITTLVGSLTFGLGIFISAFATSIYLLYFTIGIMVALGHSLCQASGMFILRSYFETNWALPLGIAMSGSGFGALALSSLKAFLFDKFGFKMGMKILSSSAIPLVLAGLLFKRKSKNVENVADKDSPDIDDEYPPLIRNKAFYMLLVASFVFHSVYLVTFVHLTRLAGDLGISDTKSALLPGFLTLSESLGKIIVGRLQATYRKKAITLYQLSWAGIALSQLLCPFAKNFVGLAIFSVCWGFSSGGNSSSCVLIIAEIVGNRTMVKGYSIFLMCFAPATLIGPPLAGYLREKTLDYSTAFYLSGGIVAIAAMLLFIVKLLHRMNKKRYKKFLANQPVSIIEDREKKPFEENPKTKDQEKVSMLIQDENPLHCQKQNGDISCDETFFFDMKKPLEDTFPNAKFVLNMDDLSQYLSRETDI